MSAKKKSAIFSDEDIQYTYASFSQRLSAAIVDWALVLLMAQFVRMFIGDFYGMAGVIIGWLYFSLQESGERKSTFGKRVMNIYVCGYGGGGISFGRASVRYLGKFLSVISIGIGFLMVLWSDKSQALHDKLAQTLVISTEIQ